MAATLYGPEPAHKGVGMPTWHNASEWRGDRPVAYGEWRQFRIPASHTPGNKRRSESKYGASEEDVRVACGMTTRMTGWVLPRLGAAGNQTRQWHCLAQLIGPNYDNRWAGGASVSLVIRDGRWSLEQGMLRWSVDLGPYVDGKSVYVDLSVTATELDATITGTVGKVAVNETHRTFWHRYLIWSHGLYRGSGNTPYTQGGKQPRYEQSVFWKHVTITNSWPLEAP